MLRDRLRELREFGELSARGLDALVGNRSNYTSLIESGARPNIGADVAERYAAALGCSLDWLISGKGKRPTKEEVQRAVARAQRAA